MCSRYFKTLNQRKTLQANRNLAKMRNKFTKKWITFQKNWNSYRLSQFYGNKNLLNNAGFCR